MNRRDMLRSSAVLAGASSLWRTLAPSLAAQSGRPITSVMRPFKINIDRDRIHELHRRLDGMIWPPMPFDTEWTAAASDRVMHDYGQHWMHRYDRFPVQDQLH